MRSSRRDFLKVSVSLILLAVVSVGGFAEHYSTHTKGSFKAPNVPGGRSEAFMGQTPGPSPSSSRSVVPPLAPGNVSWTEHPWIALNAPLMAYDASDGYLLAVGGATWEEGTPSAASTWAYQDHMWYPVATSSAAPALTESSMAYDARDGYVLLFGCTASWNSPATNPQPVMETWSYHAGIWTQLHPSNTPSLRLMASLTYDALDQYVLLFGGFPIALNSTTYELNDSWEFAAGNWTLLSPSASPPGRWSAALTYDESAGAVILWGGEYEVAVGAGVTNAPRNDTWAFSSGGWMNVSPIRSPPSFDYPVAAYDSKKQDVVMFSDGGPDWQGGISTWTFAGGSWTERATEATPAGAGSALAYDPVLGNVVLFGGCGLDYVATPDCPDPSVYGWNGSAWVVIGGALNLGNGPSVFDGLDGYPMTLATAPWNTSLQTYRFDQRGWTSIFTRTVPPAARGYILAYDASDQEVVLFGGQNESLLLNETWTYATGVWTEVHPSISPPAGLALAAGYDNSTGTLVMLDNGTWTFHAGQWTRLSATDSPPERIGGALAYDPADRWLILFGGLDGIQGLNDTWAFNGTGWISLTPAISPSVRIDPAFAFDSSAGYMVLFGGEDASPGRSQLLSDCWAFVGGEWSELSSPLGQGPFPTIGASLVEVPGPDGLWMFGGQHVLGFSNSGWGTSTYSAHTYSAWWLAPPPLQAHPLAIIFHERGLPVGGEWEIQVGNESRSSNGSVLSLGLAKGTHTWSVVGPVGYLPSTNSGSVTIEVSPGFVNITFSPITVFSPLGVVIISGLIGSLIAVEVHRVERSLKTRRGLSRESKS